MVVACGGLAGIANAVTKIRGAADDNANGNDDSESQQNDNAADFAGSSSPHHICNVRSGCCMYMYVHVHTLYLTKCVTSSTAVDFVRHRSGG